VGDGTSDSTSPPSGVGGRRIPLQHLVLLVPLVGFALIGAADVYGGLRWAIAALGLMGAVALTLTIRAMSRLPNPALIAMGIALGSLAFLPMLSSGLPIPPPTSVLDAPSPSTAALGPAQLPGAELPGARLRGAQLQGADLRGANLSDADLTGASLEGADLRGANLRGACLRGANLTDAKMDGAIVVGADLRDAVGLPASVIPGATPATAACL
jgi:Pentapeptide repeats (8 copies)